MKIALWLGTVVAATLSIGAAAQAPAGAPAGASGICKDGTYSTAASKSGACRGHGGVGTWYAAGTATATTAATKGTPEAKGTREAKPVAPPSYAPAKTPTANVNGKPGLGITPTPNPTNASKPVSAPASAAKPAAAAPPMPTARPASPQPAQTAQPASMPRAQRTPTAQTAAAPGGGAGMVWVNTESKVYHCPGSHYYGKTKAGKYLSENDARAEGDRANDNRPCTK